MTQSDETLMLAYRDGDRAAFQILYQRHRGPLYRFFLRQCPPAVAEELYQEAWMRVVKSMKRYQPKALFKTWLYTLARNVLIDHWRASGRRPEFDDSVQPSEIIDDVRTLDPDTLTDLRDCIDFLLDCMKKLPDAQREAFLLKYEAEMSLKEVAKSTQTKTETAKSRLRYALSFLKARMPETCLEA